MLRKIVSLAVIFCFLFSNVSFALPQNTLRQMTTETPGTVEGIKKDIGAPPPTAASAANQDVVFATSTRIKPDSGYYSRHSKKNGKTVKIRTPEQAEKFGDNLVAQKLATKYRQIPIANRKFDIIIEDKKDKIGISGDDVNKLIWEAAKRSGGKIENLPQTLVIAVLDSSPCMFEDHLANGFIGINRLVIEELNRKNTIIDRTGIWRILFDAFLIEEFSHELTGKGDGYFENKQNLRNAEYVWERLQAIGINDPLEVNRALRGYLANDEFDKTLLLARRGELQKERDKIDQEQIKNLMETLLDVSTSKLTFVSSLSPYGYTDVLSSIASCGTNLREIVKANSGSPEILDYLADKLESAGNVLFKKKLSQRQAYAICEIIYTWREISDSSAGLEGKTKMLSINNAGWVLNRLVEQEGKIDQQMYARAYACLATILLNKEAYTDYPVEAAFKSTNEKVAEANKILAENPKKAQKQLEDTVTFYETFMKNIAPDSAPYSKANENLKYAQGLLTEAELIILSKKPVEKWKNEDFRLVQDVLNIEDTNAPSELRHLEGIPDILCQRIFQLDKKQLERVANTVDWLNEYDNIRRTFKTITLIIQNPEFRELVGTMYLEILKERLANLLEVGKDKFSTGILHEMQATLAAIDEKPAVETAPAPQGKLDGYTGAGDTAIHAALDEARLKIENSRLDEAKSLLNSLLADLKTTQETQNIESLMNKWDALFPSSQQVDLLLADVPEALTEVNDLLEVIKKKALEKIKSASFNVDGIFVSLRESLPPAILDLLDRLLLPQAENKLEPSGYIFSIKSVFDHSGLGLILPALADRGEKIVVIVDKDNRAQLDVIRELNGNVLSGNAIEVQVSPDEAVKYLRDKQSIATITYVGTYQETLDIEASKPSWYDPNVIKLKAAQVIVEALRGVPTLSNRLEEFRQACSALGTQV